MTRTKILDKQIITPDHFIKAIEKVTADDIQRVARDIFSTNRLNLAVIGPFKEGKKFEKILKL
jgi:predicted Zn-dependent peptidase